ncbi:MAG: DUF4331 family protein [Bacteroidota bacterium]|nr:DUF4331 family protein [Bacteroidota bacterium]
MKVSSTRSRLKLAVATALTVAFSFFLISSSHREAPMIADDPTADNTDVYAFRSPTEADKVYIIANYIPFELPDAGPYYYHFAEDVRYEIHIDNNVNTPGDDIIYRFRFKRMNEDPSTFFLIRLGKENLKTTYTCERSIDGGKSFQTIINNGPVAPPNVGPRSFTPPVGLNSSTNYDLVFRNTVTGASTGERVIAGQIEDPFFVDAGGAFDLGDIPRTSGGKPKDVLRCKNVHSIILEVPISTLQKDKKTVSQANSILDPDYVIGVWASASRQKMKVLNGDGTSTSSGDWVQVSRLGMPLTNEVIIPIGQKDLWNALSPYDPANAQFYERFYNPELALYMDDALFGQAVPALRPLRIQKNSLGMFGFGNGQNGLFPLKGTAALNGTALSESAFGSVLLPGPGKPRSVDLWPIFHTGVPNLPPYQLATSKGGNPLAIGKPFINNFLPSGADVLRLNMAVPRTPRNSPDFSNLGLVQAAVLGLTDPRFNNNKDLEFIPNMDGFPNGRRLEDDVTRIELQAVSGIVLAAIGLPYDDFTGGSLVTPGLLNVLNYNTGINSNDVPFRNGFPNGAFPGNGPNACTCEDDGNQSAPTVQGMRAPANAPASNLGLATPEMMMVTQNPVVDNNTVRYHVASPSHVKITVYDLLGRPVKVLVDKRQDAGTFTVQWNTTGLSKGTYLITATKNGEVARTIQVVK